MLEIDLKTTQKVKVYIQPQADGGEEAEVEQGTVNWEKVDGESAEIEEDPDDETVAYITATDELGDSTFKVSADADLGEGTETLTDLILVHVSPPKATNLGLHAGSPEPKNPEEGAECEDSQSSESTTEETTGESETEETGDTETNSESGEEESEAPKKRGRRKKS